MSIFDLFKRKIPSPEIPFKDCRNCTYYRPREGYYGYCGKDQRNLPSNLATVCENFTAYGEMPIAEIDASAVVSGVFVLDRIPALSWAKISALFPRTIADLLSDHNLTNHPLSIIPTMDDAHVPDLETLSYGAAFAEAQIPHTLASLLTLNAGLAVADGQKIDWSDVNLYRALANFLKVDGGLIVGDQYYGMKIDDNLSEIGFGNRTSSFDVNLYRGGADLLKTDDDFDALSLRIGGTETIDSSRNFKGDFDPKLLQRGIGQTDANGDDTVTFPTAFDATPLVFLQAEDAAAKGIVVDVVSRTASQVVVKARKVTGITSGAGTSHNHSFNNESGGPSSTTMVTLEVVFKDCPNGHTDCQYDYTNWASVGNSIHKHTTSGTVTSESSHTHSVNAPVLSVDFMWLALKA